MAKTNPFRWSTKYWDEETGLVYYGYRYYSPAFGSWISRDPIGEDGGLNLLAFVANAPINSFDPYGQSLFSVLPDPAEANAKATEAKIGTSLIQRIQDGVDNWDECQRFVSAAAQGDETEMLEVGLEVAKTFLPANFEYQREEMGWKSTIQIPRHTADCLGKTSWIYQRISIQRFILHSMLL